MFDKVLTLIRDSFIPRGAFTASDVYAEGVPDLDMYSALDALCEEGVIVRAFDPAMGWTHDRMVYVSKAKVIEGKGLVSLPGFIREDDSKGYPEVKVTEGVFSMMRGFKVGEVEDRILVLISIFGRRCYAAVPSVEYPSETWEDLDSLISEI